MRITCISLVAMIALRGIVWERYHSTGEFREKAEIDSDQKSGSGNPG